LDKSYIINILGQIEINITELTKKVKESFARKPQAAS
jgi:hypothetical protein